MTMANSLELRVPLLDHKILEFAAALPSSFKVHGFTTKYLAKRLWENGFPRRILDRRKAGFPVPYESWLRKELRGWVHDVLFDRTTTNRGYFAAPPSGSCWPATRLEEDTPRKSFRWLRSSFGTGRFWSKSKSS